MVFDSFYTPKQLKADQIFTVTDYLVSLNGPNNVLQEINLTVTDSYTVK